MRSAFQKVSESLEGNVTIDSTAFGERLSLIPDDYVVQDPDIWSAVAGCVDRQERAEMVYEKFNGDGGVEGAGALDSVVAAGLPRVVAGLLAQARRGEDERGAGVRGRTIH